MWPQLLNCGQELFSLVGLSRFQNSIIMFTKKQKQKQNKKHNNKTVPGQVVV